MHTFCLVLCLGKLFSLESIVLMMTITQPTYWLQSMEAIKFMHCLPQQPESHSTTMYLVLEYYNCFSPNGYKHCHENKILHIKNTHVQLRIFIVRKQSVWVFVYNIHPLHQNRIKIRVLRTPDPMHRILMLWTSV